MSKEHDHIEASTESPLKQAEPAAAAADLDPRLRIALDAASEKKAMATVVLDLREIANFTDFFVVTSGANVRQVQAISDEIEERLKRHGTRPQRIEGYSAAEWILLDYGDFVVHVFESKARQFYDLERLWRDAAPVALPTEFEAPNTGSLGVKS
ncbi:MAG: ribosome silencing factor [Pyrinomonadaceae bacterium]